jgi:hypothetical protein
MLISTRKRQLALGSVVALAVVATAGSVATAAQDPQVTGAAKFAVPDAQVRISAHGNPARGHFFLQQGSLTLEGSVTCINVVGNRAAVGGVITQSSDPSLVGRGYVHHVEDNGSPGRGDFSQTFPGVAPPGGTCPAPIHPLGQVDQGNYVVKG